jgi:hypothetical protein
MLSYCRCADDYVVVLSQYSKAEAQCLKHAMAKWLQEKLGLTQQPEKTQPPSRDPSARGHATFLD